MPEIEIRPTFDIDLPVLMKLDHSYHTPYVWQMDRITDEAQVNIRFREVKLPRPVHVDYPRSASGLADCARNYSLLLTALLAGEPIGYLGLKIREETQTACVQDIIVKPELRHQGIGTALLFAAQTWAGQHGLRDIVLEIQSKNYPMIRHALKLGYEFCGYNDHYYPNQDIALYFMRNLK